MVKAAAPSDKIVLRDDHPTEPAPNRRMKMGAGLPLTILDQSVVSLSNFLTGVIVARTLSPDDFGVYTLFMTGVLILSSFQSALDVRPAVAEI